MSMKIAIVAFIVIVMGAGLFVGMMNLGTQYAFDSSRSSAGSIACTADRTEASVGQRVSFSASGVPDGASPHWSTESGDATVLPSGSMVVRYSTPGTHSVLLFVAVGGRWLPVTCQVVVR
jgi:hypothetical protein